MMSVRGRQIKRASHNGSLLAFGPQISACHTVLYGSRDYTFDIIAPRILTNSRRVLCSFRK